MLTYILNIHGLGCSFGSSKSRIHSLGSSGSGLSDKFLNDLLKDPSFRAVAFNNDGFGVEGVEQQFFCGDECISQVFSVVTGGTISISILGFVALLITFIDDGPRCNGMYGLLSWNEKRYNKTIDATATKPMFQKNPSTC